MDIMSGKRLEKIQKLIERYWYARTKIEDLANSGITEGHVPDDLTGFIDIQIIPMATFSGFLTTPIWLCLTPIFSNIGRHTKMTAPVFAILSATLVATADLSLRTTRIWRHCQTILLPSLPVSISIFRG